MFNKYSSVLRKYVKCEYIFSISRNSVNSYYPQFEEIDNALSLHPVRETAYNVFKCEKTALNKAFH